MGTLPAYCLKIFHGPVRIGEFIGGTIIAEALTVKPATCKHLPDVACIQPAAFRALCSGPFADRVSIVWARHAAAGASTSTAFEVMPSLTFNFQTFIALLTTQTSALVIAARVCLCILA